jgi:hypothetical protein
VNNSLKNDYPVPPWVANNPEASEPFRDVERRQRPDLLVIAFALIAAVVIGGMAYALYLFMRSI